MEEEFNSSDPVYTLLVKEENLPSLKLYLNNMKALGLGFKKEIGKTVNCTFINVFISEMALEHFSQYFDLMDSGTENVNPYFLRRVFWSPFGTPLSAHRPRQKGDLTSAEKIFIVNKILELTKFSHKENDHGMSKLIRKGILLDGYPLHNGPATVNGDNERSLLLRYWSNAAILHKEQPLDYIHSYFGTEVAFYFAWLEYFNLMLLIPGVLGAFVFLLGLLRVSLTEVKMVKDLCESKEVLCPTCEKRPNCKFTPINTYCSYAHFSHVFDNYYTIAFAIFMSVWATLFITLWRRKECQLRYRWNLDIDDTETETRQIFIEKAKQKRLNRITGEMEPFVSRSYNIFRYSVTTTICGIMALLMLGTVVLRIFIIIELNYQFRSSQIYVLNNHGIVLTLLIGAFLQTLSIKVMSLFFGPLSLKLTKYENPRTQHDFDKSVLYKRFCLAFVNNFCPLFYLAFVKGTLYTVPHKNTKYLMQDVCMPLQCIIPLCIQLFFLLTFRSFAGNIINICLPQIKKFFRKWLKRKEEANLELPQWEEDYYLQPTNRFMVSSEFSEMNIKYGLVTFFVAAFPLAPICALINNMMELRSDAYKLVKLYRRVLPLKKSGIGAWDGILLSLTYISTATNAFVIAFTSDVIPRSIHLFGPYKSTGFFNSTMSKYITDEYSGYKNLKNKAEHCYVRGHFHPPEDKRKYTYTSEHWMDMVIRFAVVFVFEHLMLMVDNLVQYFISKTPKEISEKIANDHKIAKNEKINEIRQVRRSGIKKLIKFGELI